MCNDYEQHIRWKEYREMMQALALRIPAHQTELDLPQADDVRIGDTAPAIRSSGGEVELFAAKFGFPPLAGRKGGPVFNFVSESRNFAESRRCLIPASAFFEFTGKKYPKAKYRFALKEGTMMAIAGLWRDGEGNQPASMTMLTTRPGPDVEPIHNRQVVVLHPQDWEHWLNLTKPQDELLQPLPAGDLVVEMVRAGSD
jgi:putative SOS response-associated peptidase YedK